MPWGPIIQGLGTVGAAGINYAASQNAASKQAQGLQNSANLQQGILGQTTGNVAPNIATGQSALSSLAGLLGLPGGNGNAIDAYNAYTKTPAYTFPQQQGMLGVQRSLAAQGLNLSGAGIKDASTFNNGYAATNFNSYLQQLASLAGAGQNASLGLGTIGQGTGSSVGNALAGIGTVNASGVAGGAGAITGGLATLLAQLGNNNTGSGGNNQTAYGGPNSALGKFGTWASNGVSNGYNGASNYLSNLFNPPTSVDANSAAAAMANANIAAGGPGYSS